MKKLLFAVSLAVFFSLFTIPAFARSEIEDNGSADKATAISVNETVSGFIKDNKDYDWYRFTIPANGHIAVQFDHETVSSDANYWDVQVFLADKTTNLMNYDAFWYFKGNENGTGSQAGIAPGTYYAVVSNVGGTYSSSKTSSVPYELTIRYTQTEKTELEPNSTAKTATNLQLNVPYEGAVAGQKDADWYTFTLPEDGIVQMEFAHPLLSSNSNYWDVILYGKDAFTPIHGFECFWEFAGNEETGYSSKVGLPAGTYYALISNVGGTYSSSKTDSSTYTFTMHFETSPDAEKEPNGTGKTATPLPLNKTFTGTIPHGKDEDWYVIEVSESGFLTVHFSHAMLSSDKTFWRIYMYQRDAYTGLISDNAYWDFKGNVEKRDLPVIGLSAGTYYFRLTNIGGTYSDARTSDVPYKITAAFESSDLWEKENNAKKASATVLTMNKAFFGSTCHPSDQDWYFFHTNRTTDIELYFEHPSVSSDKTYWNLYVYKNDGVTLVNSAKVAGNADKTLLLSAIPAGDYCILITNEGGTYSSNNTSTDTYVLTVTEKHDCTGIWENTADPTCTEPGSAEKYCEICARFIETKEVPPLGHTPSDNWKTVTEPTCSSVGLRTSRCTVCESQVEDEIPTLAHTPAKEWTVTKEPQCDVKGKQVHLCTVCGKEADSETIPALEHKFSMGKKQSGDIFHMPIVKEYTCKLCGKTTIEEDSSLAWVKPTVLILLAVIVVGALLFRRAAKKIQDSQDPRLKALLNNGKPSLRDKMFPKQDTFSSDSNQTLSSKQRKKIKIIVFVAIVVLITIIASLATGWRLVQKFGILSEDNKTDDIVDSVEPKIQSAQIGDTVLFGTYEQDNDTSNGKEDIEWLVLGKEDGHLLVISQYALDCKPFHTSQEDVTWETCSLRAWLNGEFIDAAFSDEEKTMISTFTVTADPHPVFTGASSGNDTEDQVFLLSNAEFDVVFSKYSAECKPTDYAVSNGAAVDRDGDCTWWLRTPGNNQSGALATSDNNVNVMGYSVNSNNLGVRPVICINTNE